jgi:hypothetical protein
MRGNIQWCPHQGFWIAVIHCEACWAEMQRDRLVGETQRANDLKEEELALRQDAKWVEPRPQPRPTYVLPPKQAEERGGMQIEPRRKSS